MDMFSTPWWSALLAIILIDLVLAGDNAIVIALAARNLPPNLKRKAIILGTVGAIVVRSAMTVGVVWLLKIPGLMLVGGLGLLWIAYQLLADQGDGDAHGESATTFWGAMKTIIVADALMGVDNVLGVAGAAHGAFDLVIIGLLAGYVGPKLFAQIGKSETKVTRAQIDALQKALDQYRIDIGRYPNSEQGLAALVQRPVDEPRWTGPYLAKAVPADPWGRPYLYASPGSHGEYDLQSLGKDGQPGGDGDDADLTSW